MLLNKTIRMILLLPIMGQSMVKKQKNPRQKQRYYEYPKDPLDSSTAQLNV
jgi:hypothetical protein